MTPTDSANAAQGFAAVAAKQAEAAAALTSAIALVATFVPDVGDPSVQAELDDVNAQLAAERSAKAIALQVANDAQYTPAQALQLIKDTLGPQS